MDSFKRTLRRRLIWLFVIAAVVLLYADASNAKGGGGHGGGHGGGGRSSSHSSSHASSHSSNRTARASVAQSTATKAAGARSLSNRVFMFIDIIG